MLSRKKEANKALDFILGFFLGVIGLIIMFVRAHENELDWGLFFMGWILSLFLLVFACSVLIAGA